MSATGCATDQLLGPNYGAAENIQNVTAAAQWGWRCPGCGGAHAPTVQSCPIPQQQYPAPFYTPAPAAAPWHWPTSVSGAWTTSTIPADPAHRGV